MATTYYAVTTTNAAGGWRIVAHGPDRARVLDEAERIVMQDAADSEGGTDIYAETERRNLVVATTTAFSLGREGRRTLPRLTPAMWRVMLDVYYDDAA